MNKVNKSKYFSVLLNETVDVSGIEQASLCIQYVEYDTEDFRLREDFLQFIPVIDLTERSSDSLILKKYCHNLRPWRIFQSGSSHCFISELNSKFSDHKKVLSGFSCLLLVLSNILHSDLENVVEYVVAELQLWRRKCINENTRPSCAMSGLSVCNEDIFPNIGTLLKILATFLISNGTPERSIYMLSMITS
ncbi:hypothetical protein PR048_004303 [Dryococelus australis]|uniref:Uncharacterized protein n=1 Tax=Dryococelus australis TaxID=614101 RepID=A0ABQ9I517_9NEOP|nr:hypothetical protein PR048_004303 [Dryococelus australis]